MATNPNISYCTNAEIDKLKWDRCIENAGNGMLYARSFYLDSLSRWDGLVLNDYEAVMPLCWKWKFGIYYLYTPYFIHSLGVFGNFLQPEVILEFLLAVPKKFRYWDIKFSNPGSGLLIENGLHVSTTCRTNYLLNLQSPYQKIRSGYKKLCVRMINRAGKEQVNITRNGLPEQVITFYEKLYGARHPAIRSRNYRMLVSAANACMDKGFAEVYLALLPGGEITAAYLLLVDKHFIYSLVCGSSQKGKESGSFYLLTDAIVKAHAGSGRVFRFEGSDIEGVAFFNRQFGAEPRSYVQIKRNDLPFPFRLLK